MGRLLVVPEAPAGELLQRGDERVRSALASASIAAWYLDPCAGTLALSELAFDLLGFSRGTPASFRRFLAAIHREDRARVVRAARSALERSAEYEVEFRAIWPDGSAHFISARGRALEDRDRRPRLEGVAFDITRQKEAEEARRQAERERKVSEDRLRLAITGASLGEWHWDFRTGELVWSDLTYGMFGVPSGTPMNYERFFSMVHADDRPELQATVEGAFTAVGDYYAEFRVSRPDGTQRWIACRGHAFDDGEALPTRMEGVALDITPHKQVEQALREGEVRFRNLAEAVPHLVWQLDPNGTLLYANRRWCDYLGRTALELSQWPEIVHPDDVDRVTAAFAEMTQRESNIEPFRLRRFDGTYHWFVCRAVPVHDDQQNLLHIVGTSTDVDPVKEAEDALRLSRARLETALRAAGMGTGVWDIDTGRVVIDESLVQLFGLSAEQAQGATIDRVLARIHPDDLPSYRLALSRAVEHEEEFDVECRLQRPDGRTIWIASKGRVQRDARDGGRRLVGACVDITRHKRLEEELRQAQKMEAIGRLAGGVAHDFNNLLTVILGQASIVGRRRDLPHEVGDAVQHIASAAERAASLTAQLLAFGRRQVIQLADVALDDVVSSISTMLQRTLGGAITLEIESAGAGVRVHADSNMLAQVLLNLAVNARDAMPSGGRLTIRTGVEQVDEATARRTPEATAGTWACLSVSDTGVGIAPEVLPRIFEPFYTTKDVGKGTGLGLATVYGIVKQHRGWVSVESAVGRGTAFKTFFPIASEDAPATASEPHAEAEHGRGELILIVEDESGVRSVVESILAQHGYRLIVVSDGPEALRAFEERGSEIDLLLTDVVMPHGISGTELVARLAARKPTLKAILCSGYSAEAACRDLEELPRTTFLQKPYRSEHLLRVVRRVLDG